MEIEVEEARILKKIIKMLSSKIGKNVMFESAEFKIREDGIYLREMDSSRIMTLEVFLSKDLFTSYNFEEKFNVGFSTETMNDILMTIDDKDFVKLRLEKSNGNEFKKTISLFSNDEVMMSQFSLFTYDYYDDEEIPMHNLNKIEHDIHFEMTFKEFKKIVKKHGIYGEFIYINGKEFVGFESKCSFGDLTTLLNRDIKNKDGKHVNVCVNLNFFKPLLHLATITKSIKGAIRNEHPLKLIFEFEKSKMTWYLAPRVEEKVNFY